MAVNQSDQISTVPASFSNADSAKHPQKTITVMKLHVSPFSNSNVNVSTSSNTESHNENSHVSNSNVRNSDDQCSNLKLITIKQTDLCDLVKGENLQQLSTNALPPYSPGSPPRFIQPDIKTFDINCCTDCGDTFALKSSLNFHLERRSVLIKFPCETCKATRIFYNRCNLLSHIRSHIDKSEKADIGKAVVTVLPRVFMDGIQNEFVNNLDDELNTIEDNDVLPPSEMLECSLHELEGSVIPSRQNETENVVKIIKVKCLDCNEEFESANQRKEHLTNGDKIPVPMSQCNKCGLACPSKCSLKAHQRIHLQISPYVCPECGDSPDPHWNNFLNHVNFQCFHNTRSVGYKCPVCKRVSPTNDSLLKHMELHTEKYAKCSECPRAYNSTQAFKAHNNIYHDSVAVQYTMIFKCSLCDIVFVSNDQMLSHRSTHLKEQICEYVFNCMQCGKPLESKALLEEHIRNTHPKIYKQNHQTDQNANKSAIASPVTYRGNVECILCNCIFYSHQGYSVHVSRAHININQTCVCCNKVIPNRKEMLKHGKLHLHYKHFVCLLCNNKKFSNTVELDVHLDSHIRKLKFCSFCPVCNRLFPNLPQALNHLREEHFLPIKSETSSGQRESSTVNPFPDTICHFCRDTFVSNLELQTHLKNEHNIDGRSNRSDDSQSAEQPFKKQQTIGNTCAKCQFQSGVREDFKKHILSHKTNQSTFQCQECGLCFVVQPSLTKHLRIVHKISDPLKYIKDEGTNYVPEQENQTEVSKRSALECSVCFTSFPNETSLKTHMRSHGMAFIQANKSDYYSRKIEKLKQCTKVSIKSTNAKEGEVQKRRKCLIHSNSDDVLSPSPNTALCKESISEKTSIPEGDYTSDSGDLNICMEISMESTDSEGEKGQDVGNFLTNLGLGGKSVPNKVLSTSPYKTLHRGSVGQEISISKGDCTNNIEDLNIQIYVQKYIWKEVSANMCMGISTEDANAEEQNRKNFLKNLDFLSAKQSISSEVLSLPSTSFCKEAVDEQRSQSNDKSSSNIKDICTEITMEGTDAEESIPKEVLPPSPNIALHKGVNGTKPVNEVDNLSNVKDICTEITVEGTSAEESIPTEVTPPSSNIALHKEVEKLVNEDNILRTNKDICTEISMEGTFTEESIVKEALPPSSNTALHEGVNEEKLVNGDDNTSNIKDICKEITMEETVSKELIPKEVSLPFSSIAMHKEEGEKPVNEDDSSNSVEASPKRECTETTTHMEGTGAEESLAKKSVPPSTDTALHEGVNGEKLVNKDDSSCGIKDICMEISIEDADAAGHQNKKTIVNPLDCREESIIPKEVIPSSPITALHKEAISVERPVNKDDYSSDSEGLDVCMDNSFESTDSEVEEDQNMETFEKNSGTNEKLIPSKVLSPSPNAVLQIEAANKETSVSKEKEKDCEDADLCIMLDGGSDDNNDNNKNNDDNEFINELNTIQLSMSKNLKNIAEIAKMPLETTERTPTEKGGKTSVEKDSGTPQICEKKSDSPANYTKTIERLKQFKEISIENASSGGEEKQNRREIVRLLNSSKELITRKVMPNTSLQKESINKKSAVSKVDYTRDIKKLKQCTEISIDNTDSEEDIQERRKCLSDSRSSTRKVLPPSSNSTLYKSVVSEKASVSKDDYLRSIEKLKQCTDISIKSAGSFGDVKNGTKCPKHLDSDRQLIPKFQDLFSNKLNQLLGRIDVLEKKTGSMSKGSGTRKVSIMPSNDLLKYFPITSDEKLIEFEKILSEEDNMKALVATLMEIKGNNINNVVATIMKRVLSDEVAELYSWAGRKEKKMFEGLNLAKGIFEVTHLRFPKETENTVGNIVGHWLRNAKLRSERVKMRKERSKLKRSLISDDESSD